MNTKKAQLHSVSFCELSPAAETRLRNFEAEWAQGGCPSIEAFVEDQDSALIEELVRVDMELRTTRALPYSIPEYLQRFPVLRESREAVNRIEQEAKRLRQPIPSGAVGNTVPFPEVPQEFLGFELIGVLGEGAFGRVYLARQGDLARRLVVLKITTTRSLEAERLAQLQHTNIVPIYSQHEQAGLQAICMPYLGIATLADLIPSASSANWNGRETAISAREWVSTIAKNKSRTIPVLAQNVADPKNSKDSASAEASDSDVSPVGGALSAAFLPEPLGPYAALGDRSREEASAWLWQQVASGLAFAHGQGIIHGDVKPANILINDRGYPMLLDFNLAINRAEQTPTVVGGTLPYLSPEQIRAISNGSPPDERSDLYALGVVFYELLTGQLPFPDRGRHFESASHPMLQDRLQGPRPIRQVLPQLNANLSAMIDKTLAPQLEQRYQSAGELLQDLECFLEFRPLTHAANRSVRLRAQNWMRRHPRLTSATSVALIAGVLLAGIGWLMLTFWQQNSRLQTAERVQQWISQLKDVRQQLTSVDPPLATLNARVGELDTLVHQLPAGLAAERLNDSTNSTLSASQAAQANQELIASRLGLAGALLRRAAGLPREQHPPLLLQISEQHQWVTQHLPEQAQSAGFMLQQSRLAKLAGETERADQLRDLASQVPVSNSLDRNLIAYEWLTIGEFDQAAELLEGAIELESLDIEAWLLLGNARTFQGRLPEAEACFSICIGLDRDSEIAAFNRARVRFDLGNLAGALADYGRAIELNDQEPAYLANRALIFMAEQDWERARQDLSQALDLPEVEPRVLYLRHQTLQALGLEQAAQQDFEKFLQTAPVDEDGWVLRGIANLQQGNRQRALLDLEEAVKYNPDSSIAWQNKAAILAEDPDTWARAIEAMTRVVELNPTDPTAAATRGVLLARSGQRPEAHRDADLALRLGSSADTRYRVAGIYALTSKLEPADKSRAIALVALAALEQPQLVMNYLETDPDIEPLKADPQWLELVRALEKIRQHAKTEIINDHSDNEEN